MNCFPPGINSIHRPTTDHRAEDGQRMGSSAVREAGEQQHHTLGHRPEGSLRAGVLRAARAADRASESIENEKKKNLRGRIRRRRRRFWISLLCIVFSCLHLLIFLQLPKLTINF